MAVKNLKTKTNKKNEEVNAVQLDTEVKEAVLPKKEKCVCANCGPWATFGRVLLLVGGLALMLPAQLAPVLKLSVYGISIQTAIGAMSVVAALYFLLGDQD